MRDRLIFYVNGQRHEVLGAAAGMTLSDYLRHGVAGERLTGTKVACAEGDCGACTVLVGRLNAKGSGFEYLPVDACIAFVYRMDRTHVVTVEGLAHGDQLAEVQSAMVDCHGSQCGYCTPGFVMALAGLCEQAAGPLDDEALRLGLSGNLCRCTGYDQILDAGRRCGATSGEPVDTNFDVPSMIADLRSIGDSGVHINRADASRNGDASKARPAEIYLPSDVSQLLGTLAEHPEARLVSGATDIGVQYNHGRINPRTIIATHSISELQAIEVVDGELVIGAGVTWSRIETFLQDLVPEYHAILTRFGSPQVRHVGTLAGNLANASPIADSIPFHYVAESTIELGSVRGRREIPIEEFYLGYKELDLADDEAILSVTTPLPTEATRLKLYKVSKRRDMDISTVTLAFWIEVAGEVIETVRIAAGGVGPTVVRLPKAEDALRERVFTLEAMQAAGKIACEEVSPISDVRGSADFRAQLIENLFSKCWHDLSLEAQVV